MWIFQEKIGFLDRDLIFWHFCTLSEMFPAELSELRYTSPEERFEENFTYRGVSDLCFNALREIFSGILPAKIAGFSTEHSSSSVEHLEKKHVSWKFSTFSSILNFQQKQSSGWSNQRSRSPQGRFQGKIVFERYIIR